MTNFQNRIRPAIAGWASPASFVCRAILLRGLLFAGLLAAFSLRPADAQSRPKQFVKPAAFGFDIPEGPVRAGRDRRVLVRDERGDAVVAAVHVEVGEHLIVMLPDGQLVSRRATETRATDKPFVPETKDSIARRMTAGPFKGFQTKQTRRYLYVYNTSEAFAVATSRIMETMFPGVATYAQAQRIEVRQPDVPLVVIMFATEDEFRRYEKLPAGTVAFYNVVSNRVVMFEKGRLGELRPDLGVQQAIATIAHEGAHQVLHNIGVQQRLSLWPMWLGEGLAEFFAPTSTDVRLKWKGAGQVNDMRMFELEQYLKARPADADGRLISDTVQAARLTSTGYATAWAVTHYLAKNHRQQFHSYVNQISRLGPLEGDLRIESPGIIRGNKTAFEEHFGDDYTALEQRLITHLQKQPYNDPFAASPHYVAMVAAPLGGRVKRDANVFRTPQLAEKWQREILAELAPDSRQGASLAIRRFANKLTAQRFATAWARGTR